MKYKTAQLQQALGDQIEVPNLLPTLAMVVSSLIQHQIDPEAHLLLLDDS